MLVKKKVKDFWDKTRREVGKIYFNNFKIMKGTEWSKWCTIDVVCDFKIKSKTAWVVPCSWIPPCKWPQYKLALASGTSLGTNQFSRSWRRNAIDLMEGSRLLWADQFLRVISNSFRARCSLLISHFHSHCHSSDPYYLLSGVPAGLITFGLTSLKVTLQSLRFLEPRFLSCHSHDQKFPVGCHHLLNEEQTL